MGVETLTAPRTVALVGNPNVGKSTLFNALTGLRQRVANYPGVTVEVREGNAGAAGDAALRVLDLPGTYSLTPHAADEAVVEQVLRGGEQAPPDVVIAILDATNLRRSLFLLSELLDLGRPLVVALNLVDEARRGGLEVPTGRLSEQTGVPVIETVASEGVGLPDLLSALEQARVGQRGWRFADAAREERLQAAPGSSTWERLQALRAQEPELRGQEVAARYAWVGQVLSGVGADGAALRERTERIDRVLLHPVLGPLVFLLVMASVFQSIFTGAEPLMNKVEEWVAALAAAADAHLPGLLGELPARLVAEGVVPGVGAVVTFLPQILILFLAIGLLEDSGYMARAAFLVDRPLKAVGLSGRAFIPLLSSFACAIPGVMATRTIPSRSERLLAILVAPLMTCSARLPVYTLLVAAFVPAVPLLGVFSLQGLILLGLYLSGILAGAVLAFVVSRTRKTRGRELPLVVELPPYRRPSLRGVALKLRVRVGDFLQRAGTVIFAVSILLWVLMSFPRLEASPGQSEAERGARQLRQSYAGRLGQTIEPVVAPLGYDWKMGVGLIASFAAREVFVATMGVVYSVGGELDEQDEGLHHALREARDPDTGRPSFSLATVFSLLAFYVFALQCGATVAVVKRETGSWRFALGQVVLYLGLAYAAALVTYQGLAALGYAA